MTKAFFRSDVVAGLQACPTADLKVGTTPKRNAIVGISGKKKRPARERRPFLSNTIGTA
jgi:hypothetical protein